MAKYSSQRAVDLFPRDSQALAQEQTGNSGRGDVYQPWRAGSLVYLLQHQSFTRTAAGYRFKSLWTKLQCSAHVVLCNPTTNPDLIKSSKPAKG